MSAEHAFAFALFGMMTSFVCRMACSAVQFAWASSGSKLGWDLASDAAFRCFWMQFFFVDSSA